MNLFISPLGMHPTLSFFSNNGEEKEFHTLQRNEGYADIMEKCEYWNSVTTIYYISGPCSFTSLRNMSVFLQTLKSFAKKQYAFIPITTAQYLQILSPQSTVHLFSVGKRETFVFQNAQYTKYKNTEILSIIQKKEIIGGILCTDLEEQLREASFVIDKKISSTDIYTKVLKLEKNVRESNIEIDYGADPRLG